MNDYDLVRLRHMLDAASEALQFMEGRTQEDLLQDRMFLLAVIKEIEIIGEAAARINRRSKSGATSGAVAENHSDAKSINTRICRRESVSRVGHAYRGPAGIGARTEADLREPCRVPRSNLNQLHLTPHPAA